MRERMGQEDQQRYSNSSGGSGGGGGRSSSKKVKQKKIPQRGLGVAQLEKIRLEELQKKNEAAGGAATPGSATAAVGSSPILFVPLTKHHNHPSTSIHHHPSLRPIFRPFPPPSYGNNNSTSSGGSVGVHGYFPNAGISSSSSELSYDREGSKLNPSFMLQNVGPSSTLMQRHYPYQQQQENHFPKVNSISSGHNVQIEPPSNQSYHSNNYRVPPWPEDDKMVGMKRPWPFSQEKPPTPSLPCNYPHFAPPINRLDVRPTHENGGRFSFEAGNSNYREGASGSAGNQFDWRAGLSEMNPKNGSKENITPDTALTLGLPAPSSSSKTSKAKQPLEYQVPSASAHHEHQFLSERELAQPQRFHSFFPPMNSQNRHLATGSNERKPEISESLDLNLKL